ncbi:hypothetical protein [Paenibacillus sp. GCM10027626]|uniref:hypothetical protein n=1 Tax=Paenibacillus sp. GCM10027626 TaxID=3273411 RepID=UPI00363DA9F7
MRQTRRSHSLKASHERLLAITNDINRIQEESAQTWAVLKINNVRTKELRENMDKLLSRQEESFKKLVALAGKAQ